MRGPARNDFCARSSARLRPLERVARPSANARFLYMANGLSRRRAVLAGCSGRRRQAIVRSIGARLWATSPALS